jgi:parallel beta-helix repeat protein
VGRVNRAALSAGDGVLFAGGQTFSDDTLMPGTSGAAGAPIVYGSFGAGKALLTKGIWLMSVNWLVFQDFAVNGTSQGILASANGTGASHVTVQNMAITNVGIAVNSGNFADSDWTVQGNTVDQTRDSGLILLGDRFVVSANTITNTGTDSSIPYGKHGIYLKASNSTVSGNTILNFLDDGISVRYRNTTVESNTISHGAIGVAWFQYDPVAGTSYWRNNTISNTTAADIYVSPSDTGGNTRESFVITNNTLSKISGVYTNLASTTGTYTVSGNPFV